MEPQPEQSTQQIKLVSVGLQDQRRPVLLLLGGASKVSASSCFSEAAWLQPPRLWSPDSDVSWLPGPSLSRYSASAHRHTQGREGSSKWPPQCGVNAGKSSTHTESPGLGRHISVMHGRKDTGAAGHTSRLLLLVAPAAACQREHSRQPVAFVVGSRSSALTCAQGVGHRRAPGPDHRPTGYVWVAPGVHAGLIWGQLCTEAAQIKPASTPGMPTARPRFLGSGSTQPVPRELLHRPYDVCTLLQQQA